MHRKCRLQKLEARIIPQLVSMETVDTGFRTWVWTHRSESNKKKTTSSEFNSTSNERICEGFSFWCISCSFIAFCRFFFNMLNHKKLMHDFCGCKETFSVKTHWKFESWMLGFMGSCCRMEKLKVTWNPRFSSTFKHLQKGFRSVRDGVIWWWCMGAVCVFLPVWAAHFQRSSSRCNAWSQGLIGCV